jgi:hypothetical protein
VYKVRNSSLCNFPQPPLTSCLSGTSCSHDGL